MKKIICLATMIFMSFAASANISLSPFYLEFDASSKNRTDTVRFTNTSKESKSYNIKFVNFKQEQNGSYTTIESAMESNPFASPYLEFSPRNVELKPGQSQTVRVQRRGMATMDDGEYVSHLLIQEAAPEKQITKKGKSENLSVQINALYGVSIPVMITKGNVNSGAKIQSAKLQNQNGNDVINVLVERFGNQSFFGTLVAFENNREIGRVSRFRIFKNGPSRTIIIPIESKTKKAITIKLIDERKNETLETKNI